MQSQFIFKMSCILYYNHTIWKKYEKNSTLKVEKILTIGGHEKSSTFPALV